MHKKTLDFNQIYKETYPVVSKYVVCHCKNIEDVKDILQEIYLHVYKQLQKNADGLKRESEEGYEKAKNNQINSNVDYGLLIAYCVRFL